MKIADVIQFNNKQDHLVFKHPYEDFNSFTQLIVQEGQEAAFLYNGEITDIFKPGRWTLETGNLPGLSKSLGKMMGGKTPFKASVYFIDKTTKTGLKWGTDSKIRFIEPIYNIPIEIGCYGEVNLSISDTETVLKKLVGTIRKVKLDDNKKQDKSFMTLFSSSKQKEEEDVTKTLKDFIKPMIVNAVKENMPNAITESKIDLLNADAHLKELNEKLKDSVNTYIEKYGLKVNDFYIVDISLPETDTNFKRYKELHTVGIQEKMFEADKQVRVAAAKNEAESIEAERLIVFEKNKTDIEIAKKEAEIAKLKAQVKEYEGLKEAEIMKAKGYTGKDELAAEVNKAFAESLGKTVNSSSSQSSGIASDVVKVGAGMAVASGILPKAMETIKEITKPITENLGTEDTKDFKFCTNCGAKIDRKAKFCSECGEKF